MADTLWPMPDLCGHGRARKVCPFCRTRSSDPDTSLEAAEKAVTNAGTIRHRVLECLRIGPMTDDELIAWFREHELKGSPSGVRTRRKELESDGLVHRHPVDGKSLNGGRAARWYAHKTEGTDNA